MAAINAQQIRKIYAIGNALGIVERGSEDDDLHALVSALTGKDSVKSLTYSEAQAVIADLQKRQGAAPLPRHKPKTHPERPGGATDGQQRCTDGHAQHTAGPELALPPGKQHLDGLPGGIPYLKVREDDRRTGQQHRQQQHLANESAHMVTGCQQIGQIQQKRADKICNHTKGAKQPAAQNIPEALPRHQHQRNGQNAKPGQHHAADQVLLLGAALFQPGHPLFAAGGRTVVSGPGAAAFTAFAAGGAVCVFTAFSVFGGT